eukprot:scaffold51359_cov20-Tisochrysis_lutea.AAC.3
MPLALCMTPEGWAQALSSPAVLAARALLFMHDVGRDDEFSINRQQMLARIWVCMGGQVAEELMFGRDQVTTGATDDLRQGGSQRAAWNRTWVAACLAWAVLALHTGTVAFTLWPATWWQQDTYKQASPMACSQT